MKHIFLNLKRFDVPRELGGVNEIAPMNTWGEYIVTTIQDELKKYSNGEIEFVIYMPEAHIIPAIRALNLNGQLSIGSQSVYREDVSIGGNFGAFTTNRTASAIKAMGCTGTIIGHCEERKDKLGIMKEAGVSDTAAVNRLFNKEIKAALSAGMKVLYCIGESSEEQAIRQEVLKSQIEIGLRDVDRSNVVIAYEPIWAIGPGKIPPDKEYITRTAAYIKEVSGGLDVVYGGGLKADNAQMLASIPEISGGLIALTRFEGEIGFYPDEYLEIVKTYMGY
jgi:Triosephosphate isomerase